MKRHDLNQFNSFYKRACNKFKVSFLNCQLQCNENGNFNNVIIKKNK